MHTQETARFMDNDYARTRIRVAARHLCRRLKSPLAEREDIEQDLWMVLLEQAGHFDAERATINTYIDRVIRSAVAMRIRHHCSAKETANRRAVSLDALSASPDSNAAGAAARIASDHVTARRGGTADDPIAASDDREAYASALAAMPTDLRGLCERVATQTQSRIASDLRIAKRTIRRKLREARTYFERAGIENSRFLGFQPRAAGISNGVSPCEEPPMPDTSEILAHEPADEYHAKSGEYLSSHLLADFRKCPLLYRRKRDGLATVEDRPAYLVGRAAHTAILEGREAFERTFAVGGPINPRTGMPYGAGTKAWVEWAESQGKETLTSEQASLVANMEASVKAHPIASRLLAEGIAEGVVRAEYIGARCQIRMDWFDPFGAIVDLKTVDSLDYFEVDARRYGYCHQLAFYAGVLQSRIGVVAPAFFIAVEKREPFRCGVWKVAVETLDAARRENEAAIRRLLECQAKNEWPTFYEDQRFFDCL